MSGRLRKTLLEWKMKSGKTRDSDEVTCIERHAFGRRSQRSAKKAGVAGFTAKSLRDTFASHLLSRGVPTAGISALLGHSSIMTTERHYTQLLTYKHQRLFVAEPGQVPADLLAEVGEKDRHQIATTSGSGALNR
jgi:integrase